MNWLERARREIEENTQRRTANSAERNLTAAMAVPSPALSEKLKGSIGSNGSAPLPHLLEIERVRDEFEERAAITEFDGGLSREEAERQALALVSKHFWHHRGEDHDAQKTNLPQRPLHPQAHRNRLHGCAPRRGAIGRMA